MPGGKIVVYTGLMALVASDDELAVVLGHEVAHAVAKHANERMSQQLLAAAGAQAVGYAGSRRLRRDPGAALLPSLRRLPRRRPRTGPSRDQGEVPPIGARRRRTPPGRTGGPPVPHAIPPCVIFIVLSAPIDAICTKITHGGIGNGASGFDGVAG